MNKKDIKRKINILIKSIKRLESIKDKLVLAELVVELKKQELGIYD